MMEKSKLIKEITKEIGIPYILDMLKPLQADIVEQAIIKKDTDILVNFLKNDGKVTVERTRLLLSSFPYTDEIIKEIGKLLKNKKFFKWIIEEALKNNRKDLYVKIIYHKNGIDTIQEILLKAYNYIFQ